MINFLAKVVQKSGGLTNRIVTSAYKKNMKKCGVNVTINKGTLFTGTTRMSFGNHIYVGPNCTFYSTSADLTINDYVTFGPGVVIMTGNHRTDKIGEYIYNVKDKRPEDDQPVTVESDVWIGANAVILKGVTVSKGCVIGAGAVVTKSTVPYGIYGGVPARLIKMRFTENEIEEHEKLLKEVK